jgi:hypothetical protein
MGVSKHLINPHFDLLDGGLDRVFLLFGALKLFAKVGHDFTAEVLKRVAATPIRAPLMLSQASRALCF